MADDLAKDKVETTRILGVPISVIDMSRAVSTIVDWALAREANYVCIRDVHGVMQARADAELLAIHEEAGLVTPDGMPLVWISRRREGNAVGRVCGTDLVDALCAASVPLGLRHYFFGGKPGVAEEMAAVLRGRYPGLLTAGADSPPFGEVSQEEDDKIVQAIAERAPHIVWVGLSTPKQEYWMHRHLGRIPGAVLIGIGAAFDFHTGRISRAPLWMQRSGLEWFHRLCSEPRRLWRRYLILAPKFAFHALREETGRRKQDLADRSGAAATAAAPVVEKEARP